MSNLIDTDASLISQNKFGGGNPRIVKTTAGIFSCFINTLNIVEIHVSIDDGTTWELLYTCTAIPALPFLSIIALDSSHIGLLIISSGNNINFISNISGSFTETLVNSSPISVSYASLLLDTATSNIYISSFIEPSNQSTLFMTLYSYNRATTIWSVVYLDARVSPYYPWRLAARLLGRPLIYNNVIYIPCYGTLDANGLKHGLFLASTSSATFSEYVAWSTENPDYGTCSVRAFNNNYFALATNTQIFVYKNTTLIGTLSAAINLGNLTIGISSLEEVIVFYTKSDNIIYKNTYNGEWSGEVEYSNGILPSSEEFTTTTLLNLVYQAV